MEIHLMTLVSPPQFQIRWSLIPPDEAANLAPPGCQLLTIWPAPVNHDACFEAAGFTLFGDNDEAWDRAAEELLRRGLVTDLRVRHLPERAPGTISAIMMVGKGDDTGISRALGCAN